MKFKKLAKVIDYDFIRVTLRGREFKTVLDSETGLCGDVIEKYGEYKVDSVEVDNYDPQLESLRYGILDIYLKDKRNED